MRNAVQNLVEHRVLERGCKLGVYNVVVRNAGNGALSHCLGFKFSRNTQRWVQAVEVEATETAPTMSSVF